MKKRVITPILVFLLCSSPIISIASTNNNTSTFFRQSEKNSNDYDTFLKTYGAELYEKCPVILFSKPLDTSTNTIFTSSCKKK